MIGWSLAAVSALWGWTAWWVFRRFTNADALRLVRRRLYGHLLEIRLYSEEPSLVWGAQKAIFADNLRFLALTAKPVLLLSAVFALLYAPLDSIYGWGPLAVGQSAVVTVQLPGAPEGNGYALATPPGIVVETPPVLSLADRQISWRIRALRPVMGTLRVSMPGGVEAVRSVVAGEPGLEFHRRRVQSIDVNYPPVPWLGWFIAVSTLTAAVLAVVS